MKKLVSALFLGLVYVGFAVAEVQDFTVVNKTGMKITSLYISPTTMEQWGKDVLSVKTLANGGECEILAERAESAEAWDVMAVTPEGTSVKWSNLKLNDFTKIILSLEKDKPVAYHE